MAAGLLVGPLTGEEGRDVDVIDERLGRQGVGDLGDVVVVLVDLVEQVRGLGM